MRKLVAFGGGNEQAQRVQELGGALDSLVRALRQGDSLAEGFARRAHQLWMESFDRRVELMPTELRAGGRVVLAASSEHGRFVLPAYNAGLRALTLRDASTPHDLLQLGDQLAALQADPRALRPFADWLWCGCALGLEAELAHGLHQLGESLVRAVPEAELWAERSSRAVEIWNEMAWKAGQRLQRDAIEQRFARPLASVEQRAAAGELDLDDASVQLLCGMVDDAGSWTAVEVALLRREPALRGALSASHLSWVLAAVIEHAPRLDASVLAVLTELGCDLKRAESAVAVGELDYRVVGSAFARKLLELAEREPIPSTVLDAFGAALRSAVVSAACEHGEDYPAGPQLIAAMAERWGVDELFSRVDQAQLGPVMASGLAACALHAGAEPARVMAWVARLSLVTALGTLSRVHALLAHARPLLDRALGEQAALAGAHLPELVASSAHAAGLVGAALLASGARDIPEEALAGLLATLVEHGQGRAAVLPLFERGNHTVTVRRAALSSLQYDARLLPLALSSVDRAREPREIRELMEELRWKLPK